MKLAHILEAQYAHGGPPWMQDPRKYQDMTDEQANEYVKWIGSKGSKIQDLYDDIHKSAEDDIEEFGNLDDWEDEMTELRSGIRVKSGDARYPSILALHDWPYHEIEQSYVLATIFMMELYVLKQFQNLREAKQAHPTKLELFGVLYVNPDQLGDRLGYRVQYSDVKQRDVKIYIDIEKPVESKDSVIYYANVTRIKAPPDSLAKEVVKKGDQVVYQRDKHGWFVTDDQSVWSLQAQ